MKLQKVTAHGERQRVPDYSWWYLECMINSIHCLSWVLWAWILLYKQRWNKCQTLIFFFKFNLVNFTFSYSLACLLENSSLLIVLLSSLGPVPLFRNYCLSGTIKHTIWDCSHYPWNFWMHYATPFWGLATSLGYECKTGHGSGISQAYLSS